VVAPRGGELSVNLVMQIVAGVLVAGLAYAVLVSLPDAIGPLLGVAKLVGGALLVAWVLDRWIASRRTKTPRS
jgi:hypothetical protein